MMFAREFTINLDFTLGGILQIIGGIVVVAAILYAIFLAFAFWALKDF